MSADNYVAILAKETDGGYEYYVVDGCASVDSEDCQYIGHVVSIHDNRGEALEAAHDYAATLPVLEYGVSEGTYPSSTPCGHCFVCINERGVVADDVTRCTACGEPITDWSITTSAGTFHRACELGR